MYLVTYIFIITEILINVSTNNSVQKCGKCDNSDKLPVKCSKFYDTLYYYFSLEESLSNTSQPILSYCEYGTDVIHSITSFSISEDRKEAEYRVFKIDKLHPGISYVFYIVDNETRKIIWDKKCWQPDTHLYYCYDNHGIKYLTSHNKDNENYRNPQINIKYCLYEHDTHFTPPTLNAVFRDVETDNILKSYNDIKGTRDADQKHGCYLLQFQDFTAKCRPANFCLTAILSPNIRLVHRQYSYTKCLLIKPDRHCSLKKVIKSDIDVTVVQIIIVIMSLLLAIIVLFCAYKALRNYFKRNDSCFTLYKNGIDHDMIGPRQPHERPYTMVNTDRCVQPRQNAPHNHKYETIDADKDGYVDFDDKFEDQDVRFTIA